MVFIDELERRRVPGVPQEDAALHRALHRGRNLLGCESSRFPCSHVERVFTARRLIWLSVCCLRLLLNRKMKTAGSSSSCKSSSPAAPFSSFFASTLVLSTSSTISRIDPLLLFPSSFLRLQLREATRSLLDLQQASSTFLSILLHTFHYRTRSFRREGVLLPLRRLHYPVSLLQLSG